VNLPLLNALDQQAFIAHVGWVFEHSPWVAERAWHARPFASVEALHAAMVDVMRAARADDQLALLRAHPDLGARFTMTAASAGEQAGAGLNQLSEDDLEQLRGLNAQYRQKFGFPFLFAVKRSSPAQILKALQERLPREREVEFAEALDQVARIARFRLDDTFGRDGRCGDRHGSS
jgi:2-oxo-4-hydroxy-4-carboxy-5-ureidoimidazoline decarboxylase